MVTWRRGTKGSDGFMEGGGPRGLMVTWREGDQGV